MQAGLSSSAQIMLKKLRADNAVISEVFSCCATFFIDFIRLVTLRMFFCRKDQGTCCLQFVLQDEKICS